MNDCSFAVGMRSSHVECEDYFPVCVVYDSSAEESRFIGFYFENSDLLEFIVNRESGLLKKMQVVVCDHYEIFEEPLQIPTTSVDSLIHLSFPPHNECDYFVMRIFTNCIQIKLSKDSAIEYRKCGQVLFGLDQNQNLVSVIIEQMTAAEIEHAVQELRA